MADRDVTIELTKAAREKLADLGYDPAMGARPLARVIQEKIKKPLSEELLFGKLTEGGLVEIDVKGDDFIFDFPKPSPKGIAKSSMKRLPKTKQDA